MTFEGLQTVMAGNSVNAIAAQALGISKDLIPERLRNRLNGYIRNETIPNSMIEAAPDTSESRDYTVKPIKDGTQTYLRNIVILDTLFDDPKLVKKLILNKLKTNTREESLFNLKKVNASKLDLLQSMEPMLHEIHEFLNRDDIDWVNEEIPYPYEDGAYSSPLISANLAHAPDSSVYDQALGFFYSKSYAKALQLINSNPEAFISNDTCLLRIILEEKQTTHQEYADHLAKYS